MINQFKVGCNFDMALIDKAIELNDKYKGKAEIKEWFGSDAQNHFVTARPKWRLPEIDENFFKEFVKKSKDNGIVFNYTMNSIQPYGSKIEMVNHKQEIQDFVKKLEDIGVYRITFANPMMGMIIREVSNIELEISCITHIDTVTQLKYFHETLGVNKFCNSILKNRDRDFLANAAKYCNENGIILELLTNEWCSVAGKGYATHCPYRDSCYLCHATNVTKEDTESYNNYPMNFCMCARNSTPQAWLRMRWIRPEDQHYYNEIGINYFKISGRTGTTEYLSYVIEAYMSENLEGNMLTLWKRLETIYNGQTELSHKHEVNIPNKKLDGFLDKWFKGNGWECENHMCGEDCKYCWEFTQKNLNNKGS